MSVMRAAPISRGIRTEPPPPTKMPRCLRAARRRRRSATRMWQAARQLEPAADHRAVQRRDHRHRAELRSLERAVPHARVLHALGRVALRELGEVEAGAEMLALAVEHHGLDVLRQAAKKVSMPSMVVSSSALRFCGRDSRRIAMSPRRLAVSEAGSLGANGLPEGFLEGLAMPESCGVQWGRSSGAKAPRTPRSAPPPSAVRRNRWRGYG